MQYELLTIREVADMVRMNVSTIYRLVKQKQFPRADPDRPFVHALAR